MTDHQEPFPSNDDTLIAAPPPKLLVASPTFGLTSEVWILRQLKHFKRVKPSLLYWKRATDARPKMQYWEMSTLGYQQLSQHGWRRWIRRVRNVRSGNYARGGRSEEQALECILDASRPDVILCHFGQVGLRLLPVARRTGVPIFIHFHGADLSSWLSNRWYRRSLERCLQDFDGVVVVGRHQYDWMRQRSVRPERLHYIPCGVPTAEFEPMARQPGNSVRYIAVSRLVPWKGVAESLRAFHQVLKQRRHDKLEIVGDGRERPALEAYVREHGLSDAVQFTGALSPAAVREALQRADIFLQHSLTSTSGWVEGFGVSIAEAAAMGLPVIATCSGGIPDQVVDDRTGVLIQENDITAMASAMLQLANDRSRRLVMGKAGRDRMIRHFDSTQQTATLEKALLSAL